MSKEKLNKIIAYTVICLGVYAAVLMTIMCIYMK